MVWLFLCTRTGMVVLYLYFIGTIQYQSRERERERERERGLLEGLEVGLKAGYDDGRKRRE